MFGEKLVTEYGVTLTVSLKREYRGSPIQLYAYRYGSIFMSIDEAKSLVQELNKKIKTIETEIE